MAYNKRKQLQNNIEALRAVFDSHRDSQIPENDPKRKALSIMQDFSGFGGLKCVLNPAEKDSDIEQWTSDKELFPLVRELFELIRNHSRDEQQYKEYCQSLRNSVLTGFYTPQPIVSVIHDGLKKYGIIPDRFLDPAAGTGRFADTFANTDANHRIICFEKDLLTGQVLQTLHPSFQVFKEGFENIEKPLDNYFDIVATNIPYATTQVSDPVFLREKKESVKRRSLGSLHNYFFVKGLDTLREGGVLAYIASHGVMDSPGNEYVRRYLVENANLITAIRLPDNTFTDSAGTEAGTDLIVLQKQTGKTKLSEREKLFIETRQLLTVEDISVNRFYTNPGEDHGMDRIVKTGMKIGTDQYGKPGIEYTHEGGVEGIATDLKRMLSNDVQFYINKALYTSNRIIAPKKNWALSLPQPQPITISSPAVRQLDTFVRQTQPVTTANVNLRNRRRARGKGDVSGMTDLFSQPNLPYEDTAESIKPENFDERPFAGERLPHYKAGTLLLDNGQIGYIKELYRNGATFQPLKLGNGQMLKAQAYIRLRDCYEKLYEYESTRFEENKTLRESLNYSYNRFVNSYGDLNKKDNAKLILTDTAGRGILSLERFIDGQKQLADIFDHPVAFSQKELEHVDTTGEALGASLNKYGKINLDYMLYLTGKQEPEILNDLKGRIFYNPLDNEWQISAKLIAGNVVEKADQFRQYLSTNPQDLKAQEALEVLEKATPRWVEFEELDFNFGERWIPTGIYSEYATYLFQTPVHVNYRESIDHYNVKSGEKNAIIRDKFAVKTGDKTIDGIELMKHALLNTVPHLTKTVLVNGISTIVTDTKAMQLANMHIDNIRNGFGDWLKMQAPEFKKRVTDIYNRKYNAYVRPDFDGSFLTFPNLKLNALGIEKLYDSQKDAVWMLLMNGGGIIDHEAGGGKSLIICITAYEMKRLGLANKPMILALKENVQEIAQSFQAAYPDAKLLVPGENDFTKRKREQLFNEMKNNDWTAIILTHEQFAKIRQSPETQSNILQKELDEIVEALNVMEQGGSNVSRRMKRGLQIRLDNRKAKLLNLRYEMDHKRDDVVDFGQMGVDHILLDESQFFKNLMFTTRHDRVAGLGNPTGSQRATNLLYSLRTLQDRKGSDLQASFFSGTTISNSLTEQYLLTKYLTPYKLKQQGIHCFDAWAALFAKKTTSFEFNVTNQIVAKERFRFFKNVPELANDYACITDYRTAKDIGIDRPEVEEVLVNIPQTKEQRLFAQDLIQFAQTGDATYLGRGKLNDREKVARMLIATNYANKMALDMRLISPKYDDDPGNKASQCAAKIAEYYHKFDEWKGTQLVFTDLGTYKPDQWNVCSEIKRKLIEDYGIPADEIRFTQECKTRGERQQMIADTRNGKIRVLFGSTKKLGTGVNVQDRVVAMHHLDIPWKPDQFEQRNRRGSRKGNWVAKQHAGNKVACFIYAVERSLDNYKLNLLHTKATFIRQIKNRSIAARVIDEGAADEENGVNFAEYVAILSGNTDLLEKAKLEQRIAAMKSEQVSFYQQQALSRSKLDGCDKEHKTNAKGLSILKKDLKYLDKVAPADKDGNRPNALHLIGVNDTDVKTQADALARIDKTARTNGEYQKIGEIYGFDVVVSTISWTNVQHETCYANQFYVDNGKGIYYSFNNGYLASDPKLATSNFIKALTKIPTLIANSEKKKIELERDIPILQEVTKSKWGKEETLSALQNELSVLDRKIQAEIDKINTTKETENDDANEQDIQNKNLLQLTDTPDCKTKPVTVSITTHSRTTAPRIKT